MDYLGLLRLDGRVAVVTGAGAGIGRAAAHALAQAGATVAVTDLDEAAARRVAGEIGPASEAHRLDVAEEAQVRAVLAEVARRHGRVDVLVNNAGIGARVPTAELPADRWERALAVGPTGSFLRARGRAAHAEGGARS